MFGSEEVVALVVRGVGSWRFSRFHSKAGQTPAFAQTMVKSGAENSEWYKPGKCSKCDAQILMKFGT
uniref:Transposase n=1 Tax=Bursaphelenchus xylophilus TaxID=6326 RepID=A0A1I7SP85_BURXY